MYPQEQIEFNTKLCQAVVGYGSSELHAIMALPYSTSFLKYDLLKKKRFQEKFDKITFFRYEKPYEKLKYQNN